MPLALDHLTVTDTTPVQLVEAAHAAGCRAVCLFMEPMDVLPQMPRFELYGSPPEQRALRARMDDLGVGLDIVYPFTLAGRTELGLFRPALECAAFLGARAVNVLAYDREPGRRVDKIAAFSDLAREYGLGVVVEFYPASQVRSLDEALALVEGVGRPGEVAVNVDLLHLIRSGGTIAGLAAVPAGAIGYGQICDGAPECDQATPDYEASSQRRLAGTGSFDLAGFAAALPPGCPLSVELPQEDAIRAGIPAVERARRAVAGVRSVLRTA